MALSWGVPRKFAYCVSVLAFVWTFLCLVLALNWRGILTNLTWNAYEIDVDWPRTVTKLTPTPSANEPDVLSFTKTDEERLQNWRRTFTRLTCNIYKTDMERLENWQEFTILRKFAGKVCKTDVERSRNWCGPFGTFAKSSWNVYETEEELQNWLEQKSETEWLLAF